MSLINKFCLILVSLYFHAVGHRNSRVTASKSIGASKNFKTCVLRDDAKISQTLSHQIQIPHGRPCHIQCTLRKRLNLSPDLEGQFVKSAGGEAIQMLSWDKSSVYLTYFAQKYLLWLQELEFKNFGNKIRGLQKVFFIFDDARLHFRFSNHDRS